jgi:hypothetical protein
MIALDDLVGEAARVWEAVARSYSASWVWTTRRSLRHARAFIPTACECNRVQSSERLAFTILLCTQRGDARFNLGFPLSEARPRLVSPSVRQQLQLRFTSDAVEA